MNKFTIEEIYRMPLSQVFTALENRADNSECDGDCDKFTPFIKCKGCEAKYVLNDIGQTMRRLLE